ncbi:MAG: polyprenyl diphosphate synthase [Candidatus Peribacteraceae bacterium]|nr:polyprenyl diphosphate synthase [Candidatus Peribacteraceae bacterium]
MTPTLSPAGKHLHIAIIPDGNRRWAKERNLHPWKGHEQATENFRTLTEWCLQSPDVAILTVWCFSTENWKRDPKEIAELMSMLERYLRKERKGFTEKKTRFCHSGRRDRIPPTLAKLIADVEEETKEKAAFTLHLAVDYGGKDEVIRAIERVNGKATDESIRSCLDHPELSDIDLIVRTSGEQRTSNFCLWQSTYAEWEFSPKYFPDFTADDLAQAIEHFHERKRRFGA